MLTLALPKPSHEVRLIDLHDEIAEQMLLYLTTEWLAGMDCETKRHRSISEGLQHLSHSCGIAVLFRADGTAVAEEAVPALEVGRFVDPLIVASHEWRDAAGDSWLALENAARTGPFGTLLPLLRVDGDPGQVVRRMLDWDLSLDRPPLPSKFVHLIESGLIQDVPELLSLPTEALATLPAIGSLSVAALERWLQAATRDLACTMNLQWARDLLAGCRPLPPWARRQLTLAGSLVQGALRSTLRPAATTRRGRRGRPGPKSRVRSVAAAARARRHEDVHDLLAALPEAYLDAKLSEIVGLTHRVLNALADSGYETLGDLRGLSDETLSAIPRLGAASIENIKDIVAAVLVSPSPSTVHLGASSLVAGLPPGVRDLRIDAVIILKSRTRYCLARAGYTLLGDLLDAPNPKLLKIGGFGAVSLADLQQALRSFRNRIADHDVKGATPDNVLERVLRCRPFVREVEARLPSRSDKRVWTILRRRYFSGECETLSAVARTLGVTRKRARRLETSALQQLRSCTYLSQMVSERLEELLTGRTAPLTLGEVERLDPWLAGVARDPQWTVGLLRVLGCKFRVVDLGPHGSNIVTSASLEDLDDLRNRFVAYFARQPEDARREDLLEPFLAEQGAPELRSVLDEVTAECVRIRGRARARPTIRYRIMHSLEREARPMSVTELTTQFEREGEPIRERRMRALLNQIDVINTGPSTYIARSALAKWDDWQPRIAESVVALMNTKPSRQWSSVELLEALQGQGSDWAGDLPGHYAIDYLLEKTPDVTGFGRRMWGLTTHHTRRLTLTDITRDVLIDAGHPLSNRELITRVRRIRGTGPTLTVKWPLVHLSDGRIGLGERDAGIATDRFKALIRRVKVALAGPTGRLSREELARLRDDLCPSLFAEDPFALAGILNSNVMEMRLDGDGSAVCHPRVWSGKADEHPIRRRRKMSGLRRLTPGRWLQLLDGFRDGVTLKELTGHLEREHQIRLPEWALVDLLAAAGWTRVGASTNFHRAAP